ncbi:hypothetical protein C8R44DRAFT_752293 [Mycena epipterygia]|nr:hypothetical protein C8R44DRAFT_752293 [Mycena epipterygia]
MSRLINEETLYIASPSAVQRKGPMLLQPQSGRRGFIRSNGIDEKKGIQHPLKVEFSMGINVVNREDSSIPAVQTTDQLAIVEEQVIDLQRSAALIPDKASLSLLVGVIDVSNTKASMLKQILNKVVQKFTPKPQLDASMNKWRQPAYPLLNINFRKGSTVWKLVAAGEVHKSTEEVNQSGGSKGKGCETGEKTAPQVQNLLKRESSEFEKGSKKWQL